MACLTIILLIVGLFIRFFLSFHSDWTYKSLFNIALAYNAWVVGIQLLFLYCLVVIFDIDLEYELERFSDKKYIGATNLGIFLLLQFMISFISLVSVYNSNIFEKQISTEWGEFYILRGGFNNIDYYLCLIFFAISFICCFLTHLFRRHRRTLMKVEDTDKKIDELSQQIKELNEQLKHK